MPFKVDLGEGEYQYFKVPCELRKPPLRIELRKTEGSAEIFVSSELERPGRSSCEEQFSKSVLYFAPKNGNKKKFPKRYVYLTLHGTSPTEGELTVSFKERELRSNLLKGTAGEIPQGPHQQSFQEFFSHDPDGNEADELLPGSSIQGPGTKERYRARQPMSIVKGLVERIEKDPMVGREFFALIEEIKLKRRLENYGGIEAKDFVEENKNVQLRDPQEQIKAQHERMRKVAECKRHLEEEKMQQKLFMAHRREIRRKVEAELLNIQRDKMRRQKFITSWTLMMTQEHIMRCICKRFKSRREIHLARIKRHLLATRIQRHWMAHTWRFPKTPEEVAQ